MIKSVLFDLCKNIQKSDCFSDLISLIDELTIIEEIDGRLINRSPHGGMGSLASGLNKQLWGYLYVDEYYESLSIPDVYSINSHLTNDERFLIESAYLSFQSIPTLVSNALKEKYPFVEDIINPYMLLRPIQLKTQAKPLLPAEKIEPIANAIINSSICDYLLSTKYDKTINQFTRESLKEIAIAFDREITDCINKGPSRTIKSMYYGLRDGQVDAPTLVSSFSIMLYSLRSIIDIINHMFFSAILGGDLIVLNNDNIYSLEPRESNILFEKQIVHSVDLHTFVSGSPVGEIILVDCDVNDNHIHEFGLVHGTKYQFADEFGPNSQFSLLYVDDELNSINHLTKVIIESL